MGVIGMKRNQQYDRQGKVFTPATYLGGCLSRGLHDFAHGLHHGVGVVNLHRM
jgi:hypothetical protein